MAAIFSKNCIISNDIDYYCLVCAKQFAAEENTLAHILDPLHKRKLNACGYLEKYKEDRIRKINGIYFCESCNLTFPTSTKVDLHILDSSHTLPCSIIKRVQNEIIAFDKYIITEDAWNGLIDDTCVICTTEFDDRTSHMASRSHILNLMKSTVNIQYDVVYRKIDDKSNQCLTCNMVIGIDPIDHFDTRRHQNALKLYEQINNCENENTNSFTNKINKSKLSECVDKYQDDKVNIDLINETAVCNKCSKNVDFNTDAIEKHIEEHKKTPNKKTKGNDEPLPTGNKTNGTDGKTLYTTPVSMASGRKLGSDPKTSAKKSSTNPIEFAKKSGINPMLFPKKSVSQKNASAKRAEEFASHHGLTHNRADNSFYCKICSRRVPATLEDLEKHVAASTHKDNQRQSSVDQITTKATVKEPLFESIISYEIVEAEKEIINIINNKHWINAFSFYLIAKFKRTIFCHACDIDLLEENLLNHIISDAHRDIVTKCLWITSLEDEFIREIKLEVYHCGYCDHVEHSWDDILEHIELAEHKENKFKARQNLRNHTPNPFQCVTNTDIQRMLILFHTHAKRCNSLVEW